MKEKESRATNAITLLAEELQREMGLTHEEAIHLAMTLHPQYSQRFSPARKQYLAGPEDA